MKVSIVLPVYNKAPFLRECLDSIRAQTFTDFEIIAVDDCSTDASLEILRAYDAPRLRVEALPQNMGPAGAAQRAMDLAQGEYIVRMDADDIMVPERLALQVAFMDAHPAIGASGGAVQLFGAESGSWHYPTDPDALMAELLFGVPVPQGASILRTAVVRASGVRYLDHWPRIGEDWLFWSALARHTRLANIDAVILRYRRGEQNIAHGQDRAATRRERIRLVLGSFGLAPTDAQIEAHLLASHIVPAHVGPDAVRACHDWISHLHAWNRTSGFAPPAAMEQRLDHAWYGLFHRLADQGFAPAWTHIQLSPDRKKAHLIYLLKRRLRAWTGQ